MHPYRRQSGPWQVCYAVHNFIRGALGDGSDVAVLYLLEAVGLRRIEEEGCAAGDGDAKGGDRFVVALSRAPPRNPSGVLGSQLTIGSYVQTWWSGCWGCNLCPAVSNERYMLWKLPEKLAQFESSENCGDLWFMLL